MTIFTLYSITILLIKFIVEIIIHLDLYSNVFNHHISVYTIEVISLFYLILPHFEILMFIVSFFPLAITIQILILHISWTIFPFTLTNHLIG